MKNIGMVILAVCLATLGSMAAWAQVNTSNTAYGQDVLNGGNTTPWGWDTGIGSDALSVDSTGVNNTAIGSYALASTTSGSYNTASGNGALWNNSTGNYNTASGYFALLSNTTGNYNTASGNGALLSNSTGNNNTASGNGALSSNSTGNYNTASGYQSLLLNTTGGYNAAYGLVSLYKNTTGFYNTAVGGYALHFNSTGSNNIGVGYDAGFFNPAGASYNIDIGSYGSASDGSPTIRIGNPNTQTAFYAAGVYGIATGVGDAVPMVIDSNGQLGIYNSSIRFKEDVHDMAAASDGLMRLRPVTYRYKKPYADGSKPIDYGLIAEEVAEVYPDLVVKGADGQIQTVQYQKLTPMLLNEVQKEHKQLEVQAAAIQQQEKSAEQQAATIDKQTETIQALQKQLAALPLLEKRLAALEAEQPSATTLETRLETK
ncbi:MAG: tail fiber domain-containing protein [Terracidiphilus sp.]|jgi:polyhydroxyalkanoate synthesis regulator phasin